MKAKLGSTRRHHRRGPQTGAGVVCDDQIPQALRSRTIGNPALRRTRKENALRRAAKELGFIYDQSKQWLFLRSEIGVDLLESPLSKTGFWSRPEETGLPRGVGARGCRGDSAVGQAIHRRYNGAFKPV